MAIEGILVGGVLEVLKNVVIPAVAKKVGFTRSLKNDLKELQNNLEIIHAKMVDAEEKKEKNNGLRLWLKRLKDVVYDADDVMDEFSYKTMRRTERESFKYKARDFVSSSNPLAYRRKLTKKIKEINKKVDEIEEALQKFDLKIVPSGTTITGGESSERRSRQTTYYASQSQIVGREEDKNRLIKILTTVTTSSSVSPSNGDHRYEKIPAISVVGLGGLGKTTLAQLVYNDDSVIRYFETRIWVWVSDEFHVHRVLSDIMEFITEKNFSDVSNSEELARKVREQLSGKRYLLVLDDLWSDDAEQWKKLLQSSLNFGAQGSKILVTTRKKQVADVVKGSVPPYFLEDLQADQCWSIMERKAFSPGGALKTPIMISIGKEIANKCGGLPLAAKFLGSLMHFKNTERNWLSVKENDLWRTPESKIIPILKLSYDNLSPHLQLCFSYCSIFPKNLELSKQTLIQLWMAEGFLEPSNVGNECSFEDIGDEYFESLIRSCFFDGVETNELGDVKTFKMHDIVHDLAQAVVGDHECSTVKVGDLLGNNSESRRLNLIVNEHFLESKIIYNIKKLRTLIIHEQRYFLNLGFSSNKHLRILYWCQPTAGSNSMIYWTSKLRQLRYLHVCFLDLSCQLFDEFFFRRLHNLKTLVLSWCENVQNRVREIGSLKHLRHLDISFTDIVELPDSVTSLHNLRRLDLSHCENFTAFPESVTGLEFLRFINMSFTAIEKIPDFVTSLLHLKTLDINTCQKLKTLPEYVAGLKNLSIFDFKNCPLLDTLPKDFGTLYQLRYVDLEGTRIQVFPEGCSNLQNLEYASLWLCELPKEVTNWIKLRKLHYYSGRPMGIGKLILLEELSYDVPEKVINEPAEFHELS